MEKYLPQGNMSDASYTYAYSVSATMRHAPTECGNNLTRASLMKQAASMHDLVVPILLPGIKINTSPTDFYPIQSVQLARFDGETWKLFGEVLSSESSEQSPEQREADQHGGQAGPHQQDGEPDRPDPQPYQAMVASMAGWASGS